MNWKPPLVDQLVAHSDTQAEIGGKWYIAKPLTGPGKWFPNIVARRLYWAWLVFIHRALPVQYAEDQISDHE